MLSKLKLGDYVIVEKKPENFLDLIELNRRNKSKSAPLMIEERKNKRKCRGKKEIESNF